MNSMSDLVKLPIRLSYWMNHNLEHAREFRQWAERAEDFGLEEVSSKLEEAAKHMERLNRYLESALELISNSDAVATKD